MQSGNQDLLVFSGKKQAAQRTPVWGQHSLEWYVVSNGLACLIENSIVGSTIFKLFRMIILLWVLDATFSITRRLDSTREDSRDQPVSLNSTAGLRPTLGRLFLSRKGYHELNSGTLQMFITPHHGKKVLIDYRSIPDIGELHNISDSCPLSFPLSLVVLFLMGEASPFSKLLLVLKRVLFKNCRCNGHLL
jgi:hypothetical protein